MPDPILMVKAGCVAGVVAGVIFLLFAWPWRAPSPSRLALGWVLGTAAGAYTGWWLFGFWPRWPALEDRDRFLTVVIPAAVTIEAIAGVAAIPRWLAWGLPFALVSCTAPILLCQTVYLADLAGPGTREWPPALAFLILAGLAAALGLVWILLARSQTLASGRTAAAALFLATAAAGPTVMLSGYLTGGEIAIPLAGALAGVMAASFLTAPPLSVNWPLGVNVIGLFGVLVLGRFLGALATLAALCLFAAPLLIWIPEIPPLRKLSPLIRAVCALVLVAIPLAFVVATAQKHFAEDSAPTSDSGDPSLQDYLDFGK